MLRNTNNNLYKFFTLLNDVSFPILYTYIISCWKMVIHVDKFKNSGGSQKF
jgi:hypothetical protein